MSIPNYYEFFPVIVKYLSDGEEYHRKDIEAFAVNSFNLKEEERNRVYETSGDNIAETYVGWAISDLKIAGLIKNTRNGYYKITELGKEIFNKCPKNINRKFLNQYGGLKFFEENYRKKFRINRDFSNFKDNKNSLENVVQKSADKKEDLDEDLSIPKWHEFFPSIMEYLADGRIHSIKEVKKFAADSFNLIEEERNKTYEGSEENIAENRAGWAVSDLKMAGLIESTNKGYYKITAFGKEIFSNHPEYLNYKFLHQYGDSRLFKKNYRKEKTEKKAFFYPEKIDYAKREEAQEQENVDPTKKIESAFSDLNKTLGDKILMEIMKISDYDFEHLVTKLLIKMGYGSKDFNKNAVTKKSCDGGIDSVVTADRFGFEFICIQAKKWDLNSTVGRPEVQKFLGALVGKSAKKGLFITTAKFSSDAINFAAGQLSSKIVLVDGKALAELMIEYGLGVNIVKTFNLKRIDSDFFTSFSKERVLI